MKRSVLIISVIISVFIFFLLSRVKPGVTKFASNSIMGQKTIIEQKTKSESTLISPEILETPSYLEEQDSGFNPDRDYLLWRKESDQVEEAWNKEIYSHIQYVDRNRAEEIYRSYLKERKSYLAPLETHLSDSLNDLSRLNGESIVSGDEYIQSEMYQDEFITKLRSIFGENYEYIELQRKIFLDFHADNYSR